MPDKKVTRILDIINAELDKSQIAALIQALTTQDSRRDFWRSWQALEDQLNRGRSMSVIARSARKLMNKQAPPDPKDRVLEGNALVNVLAALHHSGVQLSDGNTTSPGRTKSGY